MTHVRITARPVELAEFWREFSTTQGVTMASRTLGYHAALIVSEERAESVRLDVDEIAASWGVSVASVMRGLAGLVEGRWLAHAGTRSHYRLSVPERVEV